MIIRTSQTNVFFSDLMYPGENERMDPSVQIQSEGNKQAKIINMKLTATCQCRVTGTDRSREVLEVVSNYSILTDGSISVNELYRIYEQTMLLLIDRLRGEEEARGLALTNLQPLTIGELSEELVALSQLFSH